MTITTPERYKDAKYEDVPERIQKLFEKVRETRRGMYIHGGVGVGKTHIAYALRAKWIEIYRIPIKLWNMTELLREIRADYDRNKYNKTHVEEILMEFRGLLILDDVGSEKMTDWVGETFYMIVNKRYSEKLPTIYTSNLPIADLAERIGDRAVSRIVESCDIVELVGADRRITSQPRIKINV